MKTLIKAILVFCVLFAFSCKQNTKEEAKEVEEVVENIEVKKVKKQDVNLIEIGTKAIDFSLLGTDGKTYSLESFKDYDNLVVLFTCNHCPTAQAYEDKFIKIVDDYKDKNVGFVGISPNAVDAVSLSELAYSDMGDSYKDMQVRHKEKGYNFPYLFDGETQETSIAYGPLATPHVFVFNKDRTLAYSGRIDDTENPYIEPKTTDLIDALDALVSNQDVAVPKTKTFGCSIKWAWKDEWAKTQLKQWSEEPVSISEINLASIDTLFENKSSDKLRLINIWATWCGPCIIEFPELVKIDRMYNDRDFEFVSLSTDVVKNKDKALKMLTKKEASNTNYIYSSDDIYALIEAVDEEWQGSLPYTALIAPDGKVLYKVEGTFEPFALKKAIVGHLGRYYADSEE